MTPDPKSPQPMSLSVLVPIIATLAGAVAIGAPIVNYLSRQASQLARIETNQDTMSEKVKDIDEHLTQLEEFIRERLLKQ